jgi:quercetin dioxygenase-like cupin family protein
MGESMAKGKRVLPETGTAVPIIRQPTEGKVVGVRGGRMTFKALCEQTGGAYAIVEQQIPASQGPPPHVHRHETEICSILQGQFEVTIGGQKMTVSAGAIVVAPQDIAHTFRNVAPDEGRFLLTFIPGRFANYFIEAEKRTACPTTIARPSRQFSPAAMSRSWNEGGAELGAV